MNVNEKSLVSCEIVTIMRISWPFATMKVGDSFVVPEGVQRFTVASAMQRAEKSGKGMFVSRTVGGRIHIWRFA